MIGPGQQTTGCCLAATRAWCCIRMERDIRSKAEQNATTRERDSGQSPRSKVFHNFSYNNKVSLAEDWMSAQKRLRESGHQRPTETKKMAAGCFGGSGKTTRQFRKEMLIRLFFVCVLFCLLLHQREEGNDSGNTPVRNKEAAKLQSGDGEQTHKRTTSPFFSHDA